MSVVVTARNDDHGGNLLRRMQAFLNAWFGQVKRHNLSSELIVVDWNPPGGRPPLMDALAWPADTGPCEVRFIQVPPEIHRRYRHGESLPLYQMIAKNAAIRRARGRFILATNIDIIFSDELISFIAGRNLRAGIMYRMDRHDTMSDVPVDGTLEEQLEYCRTHIIRVCAREGYFELSPNGSRLLAEDDIAGRDSGISLGEGWYAIERYSADEKFRWVDNDAEVSVEPPSNPPPPLVFDLEPGPGVSRQPFLLQVTDDAGRVLAENHVPGRCKLEVVLPPLTSRRQSFRFRVLAGGLAIPSDPRIMNFRVFSCGWGVSRPPREAAPEVLVESIADAAERVGLNVGVSPRTRPPESALEHVRRFCAEAGGPIGAVAAWRLHTQRRRAFTRRAQYGKDVVQAGSGISLGPGWYPIEHFLEESFRWAENDAELIVCTPRTPPGRLALQIEPGPGVGNKSFELLVHDGAGELVTQAFVEKLRYLELDLPLRPERTHVFSLSVRDGGMPCPNGDPRVLNFRVFWCGFSGVAAKNSQVAAEHNFEAPEISFGSGWTVPDSGQTSRLCQSGGEVVFRAADPRARGLFLEVEPLPGSPPFTLQIRDNQGRTLESYPVGVATQELHIPLPVRLNRTNVVELHAGEHPPGTPLFHVKRWGWSTAVSLTSLDPPKLISRVLSDSSDSPAPPAEGTKAGPMGPVKPAFLHTNTCGDFTLMAREHWFDLRGYPEWDMYSFHIDSVLCYAAHHGGATEEVLKDPMRCYHIEHGLGSGWTPEGEKKLFARLRERGIPWIEYSDLVTWISQMRRFDCTMIFNREQWGLADCELPEKTLGAGRQ